MRECRDDTKMRINCGRCVSDAYNIRVMTGYQASERSEMNGVDEVDRQTSSCCYVAMTTSLHTPLTLMKTVQMIDRKLSTQQCMTIVSFRARELIRYKNDKEQSKRKKEKTEKEHSARRPSRPLFLHRDVCLLILYCYIAHCLILYLHQNIIVFYTSFRYYAYVACICRFFLASLVR